MGSTDAGSIAEIKRRAKDKMQRNEKLYQVWNYIHLASGDRQTYCDSFSAFSRWRFQPRILTARPDVSLQTTLLGQPVSCPIGIAPVIHFSFIHPDGVAVAGRGACRAGAVTILDCLENITIDEFSTAVPKEGVYWAQTYMFRDKRNTMNVIRKAEKYGFKALVVTVDSPVHEMDNPEVCRQQDEILGAQAWCPNIQFLEGQRRDVSKKISSPIFWGDVGKREMLCFADWEDLAWVKQQTKLPIVVKGVLTAKSAKRAAEFGVSGIIVSAHGGRNLDGVPAPLDALPDVVDAVRGTNIEVYMDGGIRTGNDVVKALALGARAVFIGRPALYGAAVNGEDGVYDVFDILKRELRITMALNGCSSLRDITRSIVKHEREFHAKL